jgi:hypothetical protein
MTKVVITPDDLDGSTLLVDTANNKVKAAIQGISTDADNLLIAGADGKPKIDEATVGKYKSETLVYVHADGKKLRLVNATGAFIEADLTQLSYTQHENSNTVSLSGSDSSGQPLTATVRVASFAAGNILTTIEDPSAGLGGLYVPAPDAAALMPVELVSLGGVHLGQIGA